MSQPDPNKIEMVFNSSCANVTQNRVLATDSLGSLAITFCSWVVSELAFVSSVALTSLRGDYLFVIDDSPLFVLFVSSETVNSARISFNSDGSSDFDFSKEALHLSAQDKLQLVNGQARVVVYTDSVTLERLLTGSLKARMAFLAGKVKISTY